MRSWGLPLSFGWPRLLGSVPPRMSWVPAAAAHWPCWGAGSGPCCQPCAWGSATLQKPIVAEQGSVPRLCNLQCGHTPSHTCLDISWIPSVLAQALSKLSLLGVADAFLIVTEGVGHVLQDTTAALEPWESLILAGSKAEGQTCGLKLCCWLKTCRLSQQTLNDVLFCVRSFFCCAG